VLDVSDLNDLWRLLPIGLTPEPPDACGAMARRAQQIANSARNALGNSQAAVERFDRDFSKAYLGNNGIGKTFKSAWDFYSARIHPNVPSSQLGESGFKPEFQDHEGDQTHHFAAYLSAGINNQGLAAGLHMLTDLTNQADRSLGGAAYELGERLTANPTNLVTIGYRIQHDICD
jgi:hypothetical protein